MLVLIAVGGVVAAFVSWTVMDDWLAGFAYRAPISPLLIVVSILFTGAVALCTVALQCLRAVGGDPANILRYE
jgi:putative ABC transport system permease protein